MFALSSERSISSSQANSHSLDFERLVYNYGKQVFNIAYRMTGDRHEAEDLTQETFFRAYKSIASLKDAELVDRWLYRIVSNISIDYLRRRPNRIAFSLNETAVTDDGEYNYEIADWSESPDAKIDREHLDGRIQSALEQLPPDFRLALILCDIESLSYDEISRTLGCNIGTVRSRIHRARKAVRDRLESKTKPGRRML